MKEKYYFAPGSQKILEKFGTSETECENLCKDLKYCDMYGIYDNNGQVPDDSKTCYLYADVTGYTEQCEFNRTERSNDPGTIYSQSLNSPGYNFPLRNSVGYEGYVVHGKVKKNLHPVFSLDKYNMSNSFITNFTCLKNSSTGRVFFPQFKFANRVIGRSGIMPTPDISRWTNEFKNGGPERVCADLCDNTENCDMYLMKEVTYEPFLRFGGKTFYNFIASSQFCPFNRCINGECSNDETKSGGPTMPTDGVCKPRWSMPLPVSGPKCDGRVYGSCRRPLVCYMYENVTQQEAMNEYYCNNGNGNEQEYDSHYFWGNVRKRGTS